MSTQNKNKNNKDIKQQKKEENKQMQGKQHKGEMTLTKLGMLMFFLTIIWIMCAKAEIKLPERHQDELISRLGGKSVSAQKIELAIKIKDGKSSAELNEAVQKYDAELQKTYINLSTQEEIICLIVRDLQKHASDDMDYTTPRSILKQKYKNYHIIYLHDSATQSADKIKGYFIQNQILEDQFSFVNSKVDTIDALYSAAAKCPKQAIMIVLERGQKFTSNLALQIINNQFKKNQSQVVYASSIYDNDRVGLSTQYSDKIIKDKSYRKYPLASSDILAFRNSILLNNKAQFDSHKQIYPLWMPQSYGYTLLQKAEAVKYVPEILTIRPSSFVLISQRSDLEKKISDRIRQNQSILQIINDIKDNENLRKNDQKL